MNITLDITKNLKDEFQNHFKLRKVKNEYFLDPDIGSGESMEYHTFPDGMEFYHFKRSFFKVPVQMKSVNPMDSEWFLIHINLSQVKQQKIVERNLLDFQKYLPIGLLMYGPGLEIDTYLPPQVEMELASIRFHHSFLNNYFENWKDIIDTSKNLISEDLDYTLETALNKALTSINSKIECHANVLKFINLFFKKISSHLPLKKAIDLHSDDLKNLFAAAAHLRNPLRKSIPSIEELAKISKMSSTKFKTSFKQLFGIAPFQYRNKIRMTFAREELITKRQTPSELSYALGYAHPSNFTAAYKKYFGVLPSEPQ